jgi:lipopolysaccharide export system protein LptC
LLEVDTQSGRAWTDEPVQWTQGELRAQAAGLDYDQSGARLQLKGPVRAQLSAPPRVPR